MTTKKKILTLIGFFLCGIIVSAQVGINIQSPQAVFHVDAKHDTNGADNTEDDVVVTNTGNLGIGTLSPSCKLDIYSSTPGALRIQNNTTGAGRVLVSDNDGVASWLSVPGGWYAALLEGSSYTAQVAPDPYRVNCHFTTSAISQVGIGSADSQTGTITVPYKGVYRLSVSGEGENELTEGYYVVWLSVTKNNNGFWGPHVMGHTNTSKQSFGFIYSVSADAGDTFRVYDFCNSPFSANKLLHMNFTIEFLY